jgi:hypothetical protein
VRVPPIANSLPEEMSIYTQLKIRFTIYVHLKVPHDTPPLRSVDPLHSLSLQSKVRCARKGHFPQTAICPLLGPISPEWTPVLGRSFT